MGSMSFCACASYRWKVLAWHPRVWCSGLSVERQLALRACLAGVEPSGRASEARGAG